MIMKPADERESLPAALKRVPRTATQPPAEGLLSYTELMRRLDRLGTNPRAEVEIIGTSRTGRPIPLVSITEESADDQRARARKGHADRLAHNRLRQPRSGERRGPLGRAGR